MKKIIISSIIILQVVLIAYLTNELINRRNIKGVSIAPIRYDYFAPSNDSQLKHYVEPKANSSINESPVHWLSESVTYTTNADSLHDTIDYQINNEDDKYRIITLGDSFTFGLFVNTKDSWPRVLESMINDACKTNQGVEVINLGVAGYDIEYSVERFKLRGQKYKPDLVIWLLKDDDFTRMNEIMREREKEIIQEMKESGQYDQLLAEGNAYPHVERLIRYMEDREEEIGEEALFEMQKDRFANIYKYLNSNLVVLSFDYTPDQYRSYMQSQAEAYNNTYYHELPNIYDNDTKYTFSPYDFHPNVEGHKVIADDTFRYLQDTGLIECD